MPTFLNLATVKQAVLNGDIADSDTELEVYSGQAAEFIQPPCIGVLTVSRSLNDLATAEHIKMLSRIDDVYQIERNVVNTAKVTTLTGTFILGLWSPEHIMELQNHFSIHEAMMNQRFGRGLQNVTLRRPGFEMKVEPQDTPDMTLQIETGLGFVNYQNFQGAAIPISATFVAPSISQRIDTIYADLITMSFKIATGIEGAGQPTLTINQYPLWDVTLETSTTVLDNAELTNRRIF